MEIRTSVSNYLWNKGGSIMSHLTREKNMKNITINFNEKEVVDLVIALNNYNTLKEKTKDLQALTSVNTILTKIKNVSQYRLNKRNKVAQ